MSKKPVHIRQITLLFLTVLVGLVFLGNDLSASSKSNSTVTITKQSAPTLVRHFEGFAAMSRVELTWVVFSDYDIDGFKIYRREHGAANFVLANAEGLIPAWRQEFADGAPVPATTYQYLLSVVLSTGAEVLSQPIDVTTPAKAKGRSSILITPCPAFCCCGKTTSVTASQ